MATSKDGERVKMGINRSGLLKDCFWNLYTKFNLRLRSPRSTTVERNLSLRLKSDGCSLKKILFREIEGTESGCRYPELYFGLIKRDASPAPCQGTLKRDCQSTCPTGTHISYSQPFLLGKGLEGKQHDPHVEAIQSTQASLLG